MATLLTGYTDYFLAHYGGADYLTGARARLLLFFQTIFIFFTFMLQFSMLFAGWYDFLVTIPITSFLLIGFVSALVLLRKGRYLLSANIFIMAAVIAVVAGLLRQPFQEINLSLTSYIYFIFPCVVMCAIFSDIRFLSIVTGIMMLANVALFVVLKRLSPPADGKMIVIAFNNTLFSLIFLFVISFFIMKIFQRSVELANIESKKNQDANTFIKNVLRESSARVVAAMQEMSGRSDAFSETAHDQADSIGRITKTVETISNGIDDVSKNANEQNRTSIR